MGRRAHERARFVTLHWPELVASMVMGLLGTLAARAFARRFGIVNQPNPLVPQHVKATPYLGGVGVLAGIFGGVAMAVVNAGQWPPLYLLVPAVLFCALGVWDDLAPMNARGKLFAQFSAAAVAVALGLRMSVTGVDFVDAILAAVWIVACVNAFNLTDVCDGLVAGISAVCFLGVMVFWPGHALVATIAFGACVGFLPFNAPRASIFLGDAGSHLLGFLAAALSISLPVRGSALPPVLLLLLFVPFAEMVFVTCVRLRKGLPWYMGSPDHFALRLQGAGWSRWKVDLCAWFVAACAACAAFAYVSSDWILRIGILIAFSAFSFVTVRYLLRHEVARRG